MITHEIALNDFHRQVNFAIDNYTPHGLKSADFNAVVIGGLGGSGIGGRISRLAYFTLSTLPVEVVSEYTLPAYAGKNTLVILSSYSGDTEETLAMFKTALERGCKILAVTSGGQLAKECSSHGMRFYSLQPGYQPRMALGFSLSTLLLILSELNGQDIAPSLVRVAEMLKDNDAMKQKALEMFSFFEPSMQNKFVVVCDMAFEGVATRFCQQIQENAKGEAFVSVLPEANHNMIESYYGQQDTNFIFLYSGLNERLEKRFAFLRDILINNCQAKVYEYSITGFTLNTIFEVIHVTDWLSIHLSNAKGANNLEVPNISKLKVFLQGS